MQKQQLHNRSTCKILSYHRVLPAEKVPEQVTQKSLIVTAESFRRQMKYVKEQYHLLSMDEATRALSSGEGFSHPSCSITFDDGWRDNYLYAFPILEELEVPATLFLTVNNIDTGQDFWTERIARLLHSVELTPENVFIFKKLLPHDLLHDSDISRTQFVNLATIALKNRPLEEIERIVGELESDGSFRRNHIRTERSICSWSDVKEMASSGLVSIGSHTLSHAILANEDEKRQNEEILQSKKRLEKELNTPVLHFAYPNGSFNDQIEGIVRKAGYISACTCLNGANTSDTSPYRIRRIHVFDSRDDGVFFSEFRFSLRISDLYQQLKRVRNSLLKQPY